MRNPVSNQTRIVAETVHDDYGNLIAQQIFEISTKRSPGNIQRTVKQLIKIRNRDGSFKEMVCAEAMVIFPDIAESETLVKYISSDIKEHLSAYREEYLNEEVVQEQIQIPVMV